VLDPERPVTECRADPLRLAVEAACPFRVVLFDHDRLRERLELPDNDRAELFLGRRRVLAHVPYLARSVRRVTE
jgi:hypothetical protein